ncbi:MAG: peroxiredoxin [Gammaproteobacteria bacterium]|nr:peroxiredoxin [Gammaproteobacteria bacterium]
MAIKVGDRVPAGRFTVMKPEGPAALTTDELFKGKKVIVFSLPGAFTPTCSKQHLPGFVQQADAIRKKGINTIACLSVNDVFVMDAWGKASGAEGKVVMLADGNAEYTRALGLELDASGFGMGIRGQRFAMVIDDGKVTALEVEPSAGGCTVSSAAVIMGKL